MTYQCKFCDALFPAADPQCPVCKEPNPVWEQRERERLLNEPPLGYEAAWTGAPAL